MDGLDGLQDLLPEPQGGAHGEGSSGLTPPQVSQVPTLQQQQQPSGHRALHRLYILITFIVNIVDTMSLKYTS